LKPKKRREYLSPLQITYNFKPKNQKGCVLLLCFFHILSLLACSAFAHSSLSNPLNSSRSEFHFQFVHQFYFSILLIKMKLTLEEQSQLPSVTTTIPLSYSLKNFRLLYSLYCHKWRLLLYILPFSRSLLIRDH
jgi:hypothetical protein